MNTWTYDLAIEADPLVRLGIHGLWRHLTFGADQPSDTVSWELSDTTVTVRWTTPADLDRLMTLMLSPDDDRLAAAAQGIVVNLCRKGPGAKPLLDALAKAQPKQVAILLDSLSRLGGADALAAWRRLGRTAKWLRTNASLFRQPALPLVTVLVDASDSSLEIANLCCRFNVSPALVAADKPPAPDPKRRLVLVAAGVGAPKNDVRRRILAHAMAGATVVADEPGERAWWRVAGMKPLRTYPDRELFSVGKGRLVAYKEPVNDPGEFALDLIDIIGQKRRAALHIINYGQPVDFPVLARIQGNFARATVLCPEAEPLAAKVARRGSGSEVAIPRLERVASVVFN